MAPIDPSVLWRLLGYPGGPARDARWSVAETAESDGVTTETVIIEMADGPMPATFCRPTSAPALLPGILYCHAHGNRPEIGRRELLDGRPAILDPPYGPLLASRGYAVLCADMPGFGDRQAMGSEDALAKAHLWQGRTLFGHMLADLTVALDCVIARDDVDAARIATLGISMGATHAYWLAALDERVRAVAHMCAFSNIAPLIETGAHDLHGHYMTVPGLLRHGDMADIAALVAPRRQFVASGTLDSLTPPAALQPALDRLKRAYADKGAPENLAIMTSENTGHCETEVMRAGVLAFLDAALKVD